MWHSILPSRGRRRRPATVMVGIGHFGFLIGSYLFGVSALSFGCNSRRWSRIGRYGGGHWLCWCSCDWDHAALDRCRAARAIACRSASSGGSRVGRTISRWRRCGVILTLASYISRSSCCCLCDRVLARGFLGRPSVRNADR